jgi:hypothetical protein
VSKRYTDEEIVQAINKFGMRRAAIILKLEDRSFRARRRRIEARTDKPIESSYIKQQQAPPHRIVLSIPNGIVVVGGDAHYWPGPVPFMHRAFCFLINRFRKEKTLRAVIANGDMMDFPAMSRWPQINWEKQPEPAEEIEFAQDRMHEIEVAAGKTQKLWPGGNHDLRFNNWIAQRADKLKNVRGAHLKDHFPLWQPCWSVMINQEYGFKGATFVKHRIRGGVYAIRNNVMKAGTHVITNHLHASNVWGETMLPGTLYGVDAGCIADINGPQFLYLEDNPVSWREGFVVLEYCDGALLMPQLVIRHPDHSDCIFWRGETIKV